MSVPFNKRQQNKMNVIISAIAISKYIMEITKNTTIFTENFDSLKQRIIDISLDIPCLLFEANAIRVTDINKLNYRLYLQNKAKNNCSKLLLRFQVAQEVYKFRSNKMRHLTKLCVDCMNLIDKWSNSDKVRFERQIKQN